MSAKIVRLPDTLINQIAAGEVVESSASVVKELVENSIDAGATSIAIEIEAGGRSRIRITDNGCGMEPDDAKLAMERHATSKLKAFEDMLTLSTMGFRGEALPSIASVSEFSLLTRPSHLKQGTLLLTDSEEGITTSSVTASIGTTIEVKNLFYNVPARKKFQKAPHHEFLEIRKTVTSLALAHPTIGFSLYHNKKAIFSLLPLSDCSFSEQLRHRVDAVLGPDFSTDLLPFSMEREGYCFTGYISSPSLHRPNRTGQHLFLNHRPVHVPLIGYAVRDGYATTLSDQRHPLFVIHGTLPGNRIDVNVHPQKKEVRLRHEPLIRSLIREGVEKTLQTHRPPSFSFEEAISIPLALQPMKRPELPSSPTLPWEAKKWAPTETKREEPLISPSLPFKIDPQILAITAPYILVASSSLNLSEESDTGWHLVHSLRAQETIVYETLVAESASVESQSLLLQETFSLASDESTFLETMLPLFREMGFHLVHKKERWHVEAIPAIWKGGSVIDFLCDWIHESLEKSMEKEQWRERMARFTSQRAVRSHLSLFGRRGAVDRKAAILLQKSFIST